MTSNNKDNQLDFLSFKENIFNEINRVREDPTSYVPILEDYKGLIKDNILYRKKGKPIQLTEGPSIFDEAIKYLHRQSPLKKLKIDESLNKAADNHSKDLNVKGIISHESADGRSVYDRIEEFCEWEGACGENIDMASRTAEDVLVSFITDDGIKERGHRLNLFKENFNFLGIGISEHKEFETVIVLKFAYNIREKGKPFFDYKNYKYEYPKDLKSPLKEDKKVLKYKNQYQLTDKDAPDNTISVKLIKKTKLYEGKKLNITKKIYTLDDGTQQIIEVEEF